jgi:hypothetical protein
MAGKSIKNKPKYKALKRKGMSKTRAAKISNAGKSASVKGGKKGGAKTRRKATSPKRATRRTTKRVAAGRKGGKKSR